MSMVLNLHVCKKVENLMNCATVCTPRKGVLHGVSVFHSFVGVTFNSVSILVSAAYLETVGRGTGGWSNLYSLPQEGAVSPAH